jgi:hypothetical protein
MNRITLFFILFPGFLTTFTTGMAQNKEGVTPLIMNS